MPTPEDKARENIDRLLTQAGWAVRNQSEANITGIDSEFSKQQEINFAPSKLA